jgi:mRNA-degrading endonuclease toxin of MazEF toxin-antitoxin module
MYIRGDVVLVRFQYDDSDESKVRPALVLDTIDSNSKTCKITSVNNSRKMAGRWIEKDSEVGNCMGITVDSFISVGDKYMVRTSTIIKKIGYCPIVDEIDPPK